MTKQSYLMGVELDKPLIKPPQKIQKKINHQTDNIKNSFEKFLPEIASRLINEEGNFRYNKDQELLNSAQEHIKKYSKPQEGNEVICLVHPFYTNPITKNCLTKETNEDFQKYLKNLETIFEEKPLEIVVFEHLHHYAIITNVLLEKGIIDKVILTEPHSGKIFDKKDIKELKEKKKYMGGGYIDCCLTTTSYELKLYPEEKNLTLIGDLSLYSPQDHKQSLFPKNFNIKLYSGMVTINDLVKETKK